MPYQPHILVQFGGRFFSVDTWSCGIRLWGTGEPGVTSPEGRLNWAESSLEDVAQDVASWVTRIGTRIALEARLDFVKVNPIGVDGRYESTGPTIEKRYPSQGGPQGSIGGGFPQLALVASMLTDVTRGVGSRGRIYVPYAQVTPTADGKVPTVACEALATSTAQLIADLRNEPQIDTSSIGPVVMSNLDTAPATPRAITAVSVGDVMDTQRRRRAQIPENYSRVVTPGL